MQSLTESPKALIINNDDNAMPQSLFIFPNPEKAHLQRWVFFFAKK